jgi:adenylate cyclase
MKFSAQFRRFVFSPGTLRTLIAFLAIMITAWSQWLTTPGETHLANEWLRDHFIRARASDAPESRILVVDIDESSLAAIGPWPWPRERLADLAENLLAAYGAKGVALDLVLPEPGNIEGDERLAMFAKTGPLVLAQAFDYTVRSAPLRVGTLNGGIQATEDVAFGIKPIPASGFIGNHAGLAQTKTFGNIGFIPDQDGMIRRLPTFTKFENRLHPTLALALFNCCAKTSEIVPAQSQWRVPYSREWSAYTVAPAADILNMRVPADLVAGKLVLVGSSFLGLSDRVATPLNTSTPGVLVHAAALTSLLDAQSGAMPAPWPGRWIALLFTVIVAVLAAYTFPRLSAVANIALLAGASLVWLLFAYWISPHDALFSASGPLASTFFLLAVAVPLDWQLTQRKSRHLLGTLHQYVAKSVVDELLRSGLENPLVPQQRNVTTLIADMEGYTSQVESLSVEEAAQLTRDFLGCLTRPVLHNLGTLDKYTGDGLVAFWGAPLPIEDHADLALDAARAIVQEVGKLSTERQQQGKPPLRVRIGIESGTAMAGNFGTPSRSVYTAVGDSVNVASRLEDVARRQPHDIIIGQGTVNLAKRHRFIELGEVLLRGKEKPNTLYALRMND